MTKSRLLVFSIGCVAFAAPLLAGDLSTYRGMHFGIDLRTATKEAGAIGTPATTVHRRPAVIQELEWQPRPNSVKNPAEGDPIREGLLYFYNGQLFRIVITYDRYKIEGMTADDLVQGISATYGVATRPTTEIAFHSSYGETAAVIARWEDPKYSYNLVRTGDGSSYALVLYSKALDAAAQAAIAESVRLDALEAPQRALDIEAKRNQDDQLVLDKARLANKPNFRP